jgi:hypothetical protein
MFEDVDLQRFTDLFCPAGLQRGFNFIDCAAEGVVFAAADPDAPKRTADRSACFSCSAS